MWSLSVIKVIFTLQLEPSPCVILSPDSCPPHLVPPRVDRNRVLGAWGCAGLIQLQWWRRLHWAVHAATSGVRTQSRTGNFRHCSRDVQCVLKWNCLWRSVSSSSSLATDLSARVQPICALVWILNCGLRTQSRKFNWVKLPHFRSRGGSGDTRLVDYASLVGPWTFEMVYTFSSNTPASCTVWVWDLKAPRGFVEELLRCCAANSRLGFQLNLGFGTTWCTLLNRGVLEDSHPSFFQGTIQWFPLKCSELLSDPGCQEFFRQPRDPPSFTFPCPWRKEKQNRRRKSPRTPWCCHDNGCLEARRVCLQEM